VQGRQPRGPYLLGGWSIGGALALAMALELERRGEQVPWLVPIASYPPSPEYLEGARALQEGFAPWRMAYAYGRNLAFALGVPAELDVAEFRELDEPAALALLGERLAGVGPFAASGAAADVARWVAVFRATIYGFLHYGARGRARGGALIVEPRGGHPVPAARGLPPGDWGRHLAGDLERADVGGHHFNVMSRPFVDEVAAVLDARLPLR
jgi:thioesterase domain-containing protein